MRPKKYPREALAQLRAKETGDAALGLAKAARTREEAERVARSIAKVRDAADAQARLAREAEQAALERGDLRAGDLMNAKGWTARVAGERAQMDQRVAHSAERARAARAAEDGARGVVAEAHAKEQAVQQDSVKWSEGERARALAREEEDVAESWRKR